MPKKSFGAALAAVELSFLKNLLENIIEEIKQAAKMGGEFTPALVFSLNQRVNTAVELSASRNMIRVTIPTVTAAVITGIMMRIELSLVTRGIY
jgi:hypothetical protein